MTDGSDGSDGLMTDILLPDQSVRIDVRSPVVVSVSVSTECPAATGYCYLQAG